jgi:hypothetical protein
VSLFGAPCADASHPRAPLYRQNGSEPATGCNELKLGGVYHSRWPRADVQPRFEHRPSVRATLEGACNAAPAFAGASFPRRRERRWGAPNRVWEVGAAGRPWEGTPGAMGRGPPTCRSALGTPKPSQDAEKRVRSQLPERVFRRRTTRGPTGCERMTVFQWNGVSCAGKSTSL